MNNIRNNNNNKINRTNNFIYNKKRCKLIIFNY